jgi:hypothetical protein
LSSPRISRARTLGEFARQHQWRPVFVTRLE